MFLCRLLLSNRSRDVRRDLGNVHNMHRRLLTAFPDLEMGDGARLAYSTLYRVEASQRGDVSVLIQSGVEPSWTRLPDGYLLDCFEPNPATTDLAPLLSQLKPEQRMRFRLRANPTKRLRAAEGKRGNRVELVGVDQLLGWLLRKAPKAGFTLATRDGSSGDTDIDRYRVRVTEEPKVRGRRDGTALSFGSAMYDGELVVTDAEVFATTLRQGIGSGKAYGFGLLSIAPA